MSTIILWDQNFNANDVDIMLFEPCVLSPRGRLGEETWSQKRTKKTSNLGLLFGFSFSLFQKQEATVSSRRVIVKLQNAAELKTNRERPKSAPYLRLKKAKGLQSVKYSFTVPEKLKGGPNWRAGGPFRTFHPFVAKHQKNEGGPFGEKIEKSQCRKNWKGEIPILVSSCGLKKKSLI